MNLVEYLKEKITILVLVIVFVVQKILFVGA